MSSRIFLFFFSRILCISQRKFRVMQKLLWKRVFYQNLLMHFLSAICAESYKVLFVVDNNSFHLSESSLTIKTSNLSKKP